MHSSSGRNASTLPHGTRTRDCLIKVFTVIAKLLDAESRLRLNLDVRIIAYM